MDDISVFFEHQLDPVANRMAAFTAKDPADWDAFRRRWRKMLADDTMARKTILVDDEIAGHIVRFEQSGKPEITYWLGRQYWSKGLATSALSKFLDRHRKRPLYARAAKDNVASIRVLEKCGFSVSGANRDFANARNEEVEELILELPRPRHSRAGAARRSKKSP